MTESMSDFKERIARLMREQEGGEIYSVIGASRADECVRRTKGDAPTPSEVMAQQPRKNQQHAKS